MSIAKPTTSSPGTQRIVESLRTLRGRITNWFLIDGFTRLLLTLLVIIGISVLVDWQFNLDRSQRIGMLIFAAIPLAYVTYRYLIKPWRGRLSDDALCLEIEQRNKQLGESLISAVQLERSEGPEAKHVSAAMIDATIREGVEGADNVVFGDILDAKRFNLNRVLLFLSVLILVGVAVSTAMAQPMRTWFQRNILLQDTEWANHTFFEFAGVEDGAIAVPHGSNWPLTVRMTKDDVELPSSLDVDIQVDGGSSRTERAERFEKNREFRVLLKRVTSPLEVRAHSGRSRTPWTPVRLVKRPAAKELTLTATPPGYSGLPPQVLPPGEGPYYVLKGTRLSIQGSSNKPIAKATLVVGDTPHEMELAGDTQFSIELDPKLVTATSYRLELEDIQQVYNPTTREFEPLTSKGDLQFTLKNSPDLAPSVSAQLIGVGSMVLPGAVIPYKCSVEDDFGITAARISFEWRLDSAEAKTETGTNNIAMPESSVGQKQFAFEDSVSLADLKVPAGSGFGFQIEADDNDDVAGPNTGKSTRFLLRVVSEKELRENLLRREKELRQEFESVLKRQEDILTESEALQAGFNEDGRITPDERKSLMESQRNQKQMTASVLSIADRLNAIIAETRNNRIEQEGGPSEQRLGRQIIAPMRRLGAESLPTISRNLDKVRRQLDKPKDREEALKSAIDEQQQAVTSMQEILSQMVKSEGFQEAVNLLHQVQQEQRNVADMTEKEKKLRLERILDKSK